MQAIGFRVHRHPGCRVKLGEERGELLFRINHPVNICAPGMPCQASGAFGRRKFIRAGTAFQNILSKKKRTALIGNAAPMGGIQQRSLAPLSRSFARGFFFGQSPHVPRRILKFDSSRRATRSVACIRPIWRRSTSSGSTESRPRDDIHRGSSRSARPKPSGKSNRSLCSVHGTFSTSFVLAPPFKPGIGNASDRRFQDSLRLRQRVIQARSLLEFRFVQGFLPQKFFRGNATVIAQRINLESQQSRAPQWQ
jgi:hypothetical protein